MEELWEYKYSSMLVEINQCTAMQLPETEQAEICYRIVFSYWGVIKKIWEEKITCTEEEEINFFKDVKPRFTSHIEYYLILNQGLLFIPDEPSETIAYWQVEERRYQRFCDRHASFLRYYNSIYRHSDRDYFIKRNNCLALLPQERIYEDEDCRSSHDWLIRSYMANRMYHDYVKQKLETLLTTQAEKK